MSKALATVMSLLAAGTIDKTVAGELVRALHDGGAPRATPGADAIAVIGVGAQLPGGADISEFWDRLLAAENLVTPLPHRRRELCTPLIGPDGGADYLTGSWLVAIDEFDAGFFGITPAVAKSMDPQHRRILEVAYHCLEDAGWAGRIRGTDTGVYVAVADGDYAQADPAVPASGVPGRVASFAASRLSFIYDLTGPAYMVSSTCSSSLVALHEACLGLRAGDCRTALVAGANILAFPVTAESRLTDASGIMSPSNRCRPFADGGDGIGRGEGVIAMLLKPLDAAVADGDRIHAVIKSTAVNNDGTSAALTAPNPAAHTRLLERAWARAGISPETLSYLEAHGTGTELGDPIEVRGITDAVRRHTDRRQFIPLGSVKGNIGHLMDGAAGLSGVLKAMLVLQHRMVPPTAGLDVPNPHIDFLDSPVFVPTVPWPLPRAGGPGAPSTPLRAGVSCFGFNGTNAHVVLEEAPPRTAAASRAAEQEPAGQEPAELVFPVSAATPGALRTLLWRHGRRTCSERPRDVAYTLTVGREHLAHRVAVLARTNEEFRQRCADLARADEQAWTPVVTGLVAAGAAAQAYVAGGALAWTGPPAAVVSLPVYPFEPTRHWLTGQGAQLRSSREVTAPAQEDFPPDTLGRCLSVIGRTLGYDDLGPQDNFLALGGSSLAALEVQSALRTSFDLNVPVVDILAADDFAALAAAIDDAGACVAQEAP